MSRASFRIRTTGSHRLAVLVFHEGAAPSDCPPNTIYITEPKAQIGASDTADLRLTATGVAPQQCSLADDDGALVLRDRGSKSKTSINGAPCLEPTRLAVGDLIGIGQCTLELVNYHGERTSEEQARQPSLSEKEIHLEARVAMLKKAAAKWQLNQRSSRLLARGNTLTEGVSLLAKSASMFDPVTATWVTSSAARSVQIDRRRSVGAGLGLGALVGALLLPSPATTNQEEAQPVPKLVEPQGQEKILPPPEETRCMAADYIVRSGDTWELLSSRFGEPVDVLRQRSGVLLGPPEPGSPISVCAAMMPPSDARVSYIVKQGEDWQIVARKFGVDIERLMSTNPSFPRELRPGDQLEITQPRLSKETQPLRRAQIVLPEEVNDATAVGATNDGFLANGIWLPSVQEYKIRCKRHSYGTKFTVAQIIAATSRMRDEFDYRGELVIGDLSKRSGGAYGPHRSHQNGRDVDVWLPILGGKYKRDAHRCQYCNTDYCRPDPAEVDWDATWQLVKSLAAIGHDKRNPVKEIFLDRSLHSELADAARRDGISETDVRRYVQYRGRNALVKDSPGHVHHMHVRFRCGEDTDSCIE